MIIAASTRLRAAALAVAFSVGLVAVGDAEAMSRKDKRTLIGAVVGGAAGAALSNGDARYTVGGALAGGAIGNLTTSGRKDDRHDRRWEQRRWENQRTRSHGYRDRRHDDRRRHGSWR